MREMWIRIKAIEAVQVPGTEWLHFLCEDDDAAANAANGAVEDEPEDAKNEDGSRKHAFMGRP
jgi:hypothetical protein